MSYTKKDYEPIRRGTIYCAPFCGAKCTWAAFQDATKKAKILARTLGPGWKPQVNENMCWYWGATKGVMKVYASNNHGGSKGSVGKYTCYCDTSTQFLGQGRTPKLAVSRAIAAFDAHLLSLSKQRKELGE